MRTKERLSAAVRLLCFGILLVATAIRLGSEFYDTKPAVAAMPTEEIYPTMLYAPEEDKLIFAENDVPIYNTSGAEVDAQRLMQKSLDFPISREPQILIVHTHATEAYCQSPDARSTDTNENVVHIGSILAKTLQENGINALHDETLIDAMGYYDAYAHAAEVIEGYLSEYPSIRMVIDVHRDSVADSSGAQIALRTQIEGQPAAQLMLVMGTDRGGHYHPNWEENLAFALKLQSVCEGKSPGIFRDLTLRAQRYNQHLTPHSILLEVGTAGNTLQEAETSIRFFAKSLAELLYSKS